MPKKYITQKGQQAIRNFKYKGGSVAYSYQYLWSPLAEYLLKYIPLNWAPNTITVLGFVIHVIANMLLIVQERGQKVIPLTLLVFGILVFTYYTLDNIDGKQARRTKNSTPLGMCMDHGCDALGVSFITLGVAGTIVMSGYTTTVLYSGIVAVLGSFWLSTWAQYHSKGILILGKFNAVDDGIPFVAFLGCFTFLVGQDFWMIEIIPGLKTCYLVALLVWVGGIAQTFNFIFNSGENFTKDLKGALFHLVHFIPLIFSLTIIIYFTQWDQKYFYLIYFSSALPVVRDISYMHVCVTAEQKYNQFQFATVFYSLVFPCYIGLRGLGIQLIPQEFFIYAVFCIILGNYLHYVIGVSNQMAEILNIRIFHIKQTKKQ